MIGGHLLHHYSNSQANIALSSAEAELNSNVKLTAECLFVKTMSSDIGVKLGVQTLTASSAAKGIQTRRGCGKVKHLEATQLWVQEKVQMGQLKIVKVPRSVNPSDVLTHHWTGSGSHHFEKFGFYRELSIKC